MRTAFTFSFIFIAFHLIAQSNSKRFEEAVFSDVTIYKDLIYSRAIPYSSNYNQAFEEYTLDFYEPFEDKAVARPLVIIFHDGGFLFGNKNDEQIKNWCIELAKQGYTCASVNYRKGYEASNQTSAIRALYRGLQDARAAIRYFMEYQATFRIDTEHIFLGGRGTGATVALYATFMEEDKIQPYSFYSNTKVSDLGCIDCSGNPYQQLPNIAGVINIGGGVADLKLLANASKVSVINIDGEIMESSLLQPFRKNITESFDQWFNTEAIHQFLSENQQPSEYFNYESTTSSIGFVERNQMEQNALRDLSGFLKRKLTFRSAAPKGDVEVCANSQAFYTIKGREGSTFKWLTENGKVLSTSKNTAKIQWNSSAKQGFVQVIETNAGGVTGEPSPVLSVTILPQPYPDYALDYITSNTIKFKDQSADVSLFTLDLGHEGETYQGKPGSGVTFSYLESGDYFIRQTVESQCGTAVQEIPVSIRVEQSPKQEGLKKIFKQIPPDLKQGIPLVIDPIENTGLSSLNIKIENEFSQEVFNKVVSLNKDKINIDLAPLKVGTYFIHLLSEGVWLSKKITIEVLE